MTGPIAAARSKSRRSPPLGPALAGLIAIVIGALANGAQAQSIQCDAGLRAASDGPYGYQARGDRCEGLYIKEVSAAALSVVSFLQDGGDFDPKSPQAVTLSWDMPAAAGAVRLRAQGVKHRLYYRMDSERPADQRRYAWPTNVLSAVIQNPRDIGIVAATHISVAGKDQELLLPLRVGEGAVAAANADYRLTVLPGVTLQELFVSLYRVDGDGQIAQTLKLDAALRYGYYPASRAIDIPLSGLTEPGLYLAEIAARFAGGATATELWFYHPGSP